MASEFDIFTPIGATGSFNTVPAARPVPTTYRQGASPYADLIERSAQQYGLDPNLLTRIAKIESGFDPHNRTGSYKGLFQLSDSEFNKYGGGNIWNPADNARAAAAKIAQEAQRFKTAYGRDPSATEIYMLHQQGEGGLAAHLRNPDAPAWQNMFSTGEGKQKGAGWSQQAIWGNVPSQNRAQFGDVKNLTSRQFLDLWAQKVEGKGGSWGDGSGAPAFAKTLAPGDAGAGFGSLTPASPGLATDRFVGPSTTGVVSMPVEQPRSTADLVEQLAQPQDPTKKAQASAGLLDALMGGQGGQAGGDEWTGPFKPIEEMKLVQQLGASDLARLPPGLARARAQAMRGLIFSGGET